MSRILLILCALLVPRLARGAGVGENAESIGLAMAYVVPVGCAGFAAGANTAYILVDEGAPARWRTAGYVCGGLSLGVGAYMAYDGGYESFAGGVVTTIPFVVGVAAIGSALWVGPPRDLVYGSAGTQLAPWFVAGGGGLVLGGRF